MSMTYLILAAGAARRFGAPKQLAYWRGKPLLMHAVDLANELGFRPVVLLGAHSQEIMADQKLNEAILTQALPVKVPAWEEGLAASLKRGVEAASGATGVLVSLADQPALKANDLDRLIKRIKEGEKQILCARYGNVPGVPAYFSSHYFDELRELKGDRGAKALISNHPHQSIDFGNTLIDVDTPDDLIRLGD